MDERIERLKQIAQYGNIDAFYKLIQEDVKLLEAIDELPFVDTPLHIAASVGNVPFAMEMMRLKPSLVGKPNPDGFSPLHLALIREQIEMVHRLLQVDGDLVRAKAKEGMTLLHYAVITGDHLDLLVEFLSICPHSIEEVTIRNETALHIALKYDKLEAFKLLVGWLKKNRCKNSMFWERKVLNWKDGEGNTVLHVAISKNQPQAVDHLLASGCDVDVNVKNLEGKTARDIFHEQTQVDKQIEPLLRRAGAKKASSLKVTPSADYYLRRKVSLPEKLRIRRSRQKWSISDDKRNALLVVATLLITVTDQGILSPPEGLRQDDPNPGTTAPDGEFWLGIFIMLNSATFMLSHTIIFQLIPSGYFYVVLQAALFFLYACYFVSWTVLGVSYLVFFMLVFVSSLLYNIVVGMDFSSWRKRRHKASQ
ncbi:ankyrin repeat-containing protein BDA1-like isoform X2 [Quercus robur]|uniref:ankyrin repeat-containing protein BDA1-like isoform X2 n=1 Tax=Quercus robur TaxID=38942 RepID=UPI0021619AB3|nr:ankyrin repeat-containing protein BDA1-like isoform X2 [Quercus robur]